MPSIAMTANFPDATTLRGIHMIVYQAWTQREPVGRGVFNVYESSQYREHSQTYGGLALMDTVAEGESVNYAAPVEGFTGTFTRVKYGKGIRITEDMWADDLYGIMEDSPAELGRMAYATEETLLANHFNNGFSSTYTGPDGKELFATDHVREDTAAYANELTTAADLSTTSLEQALIDFSAFRDGGGKRLQIKPSTLLVPSDLRFTAVRILDSPGDPDTDTNAIQPVGDLGLKVVSWHYLTDTDAWFLTADKEDHKLLLYDRMPFTTSHIFDFDTGDIKFKGTFWQSSGWADPRGLFGSPGA